MIITSVERKRGGRGRVEVYIDGVVRFEIARGAVTKRALRPGRPIEGDEIEAIVAADARDTARDTAFAMLARRPCSEREIRRRLTQRRYETTLIDELMAYLREHRLIDDAEFARVWVESRNRSSPRGKRVIAAELRAHGVEQSLVAEAVAPISEVDAAYRVAEKRARSLANADGRAFRDRLGAHLQRRGFAWETVRATVQRCLQERGSADAGDVDVLSETIE